MRRQRQISVSDVLMLLNMLLFLAGFLAFRYAPSPSEAGHWSPPQSPFINPYSTYFEPLS
jgi:hypothetical protein